MTAQAAQQLQSSRQPASSRDLAAFQRRFLSECLRDARAPHAALEVAVLWRGSVLSVEQHRKPAPLTLGTEAQAATLGAAPGGGWALWLDPAQAGSVLIDPPPQGRRQHTVQQLLDAGLATMDGDRARVTLTGGTRARLVFGDTVALLHLVAAPPLRLPRLGGRVRGASGVILGLALSLCVYLIFGGLVAYSTERGAQMSITLQDVDMSAHSLRMSTPEERKETPRTPEVEPLPTAEREPLTQATPAPAARSTSGHSGPRSASPGGVGGPGAPGAGPRAQIQRTSVGRHQGTLLALAHMGGAEAASDLQRGFDGDATDAVRGGLDAVTSGCFGALCNGGSTGTGTLTGGPSGKPGGDPRLTDRTTQFEERAQTAPQPKLTGGDPQTTGFDKQVIKRVINQKKAEITHCYNKELMKNPTLKGRVSIKWRIMSSGTVGAVEVVSNEMGNAEVASCLKARVAGWKFPAPKNGSASDVTYPFNFSTR